MAFGEGKSSANPGPTTQHLVGQGPCALPGVRYKAGRRGEGTPPLRGHKKHGKTGRRGRRPLRMGNACHREDCPYGGVVRGKWA